MADDTTEERPLWARIVSALFMFGLLLTLVAAIVGYAHFRSYVTTPVLSAGDKVTLVIENGSTWPVVVEELVDAGLVTKRDYFEVWSRLEELPMRVKSGAYKFEGPLTLEELARKLSQGGLVAEVEITIPEGLTIFHIADRLDKAGICSRDEFLAAAADDDALVEAGVVGESFEGYLFPDTYRFHSGTPGRKIVARMHARFNEVWTEVIAKNEATFKALDESHQLGQFEVVTLASIVERESSSDEERAVIARVFLNRLGRGMKLQTDPTCVYGARTYKEIPSPKHCKDPLNRYSTYIIDGLPPGPIANPGRKTLEAVTAPSLDADAQEYIFFVAKRDGSRKHHFSKTYSEHKEAIDTFLKKKKPKKPKKKPKKPKKKPKKPKKEPKKKPN